MWLLPLLIILGAMLVTVVKSSAQTRQVTINYDYGNLTDTSGRVHSVRLVFHPDVGNLARFNASYSIKRAHIRAGLQSHHNDAVIRVYDAAGNVIETHEHKGDFKEWRAFLHEKPRQL